MCANVSKKTGDAVNGGTRGVEGATPARAQSPESAGGFVKHDLEEIEWLVKGLIGCSLDPAWTSAIEKQLRNKKIDVFGRIYELVNSDEEIQKILSLPPTAPIQVKARLVDGKVYIDVLWVAERVEEEVVEEKKVQGLSAAILHKWIRVTRRLVAKSLFSGREWELDTDLPSLKERFEDFVTGKEIARDEIPDYIGVKVIQCVEVPNPHFKTYGLQRLYVFSDGTVVEFWGWQVSGSREEGGLEGVFGSLDTGGGDGATPIFVFRNIQLAEEFKWIYEKAIDLFHRREAEEYRRQREQWKKEIEEAQAKYQQKTETIIHFLKSRKNGFITKEEIEWLKTQSPTPAVELHVYRDPFENIEVLWLGGEVSVKVGREEFRIPVKEVA
jgi:hypothetical protein